MEMLAERRIGTFLYRAERGGCAETAMNKSHRSLAVGEQVLDD